MPEKQKWPLFGPSGREDKPFAYQWQVWRQMIRGQVIYNGGIWMFTLGEKRKYSGSTVTDFQLFPHLSVQKNLTLS